MAGSPNGDPPDGVRAAAPGRALRPLVWVLATGLLALQALGRAGMWLLTTVDEGTSAVARAGGRAIGELVRALGPLGRSLWGLLRPALRGLRRAWDWSGRRIFLLMVRPLGRFRRWLVACTRPAVDRVLTWARALAVRAEPVLRRFATAVAVIARAAARLGAALRRAWAPVARVVAPLGRLLRRARARLTQGVRDVLAGGDGPGSVTAARPTDD